VVIKDTTFSFDSTNDVEKHELQKSQHAGGAAGQPTSSQEPGSKQNRNPDTLSSHRDLEQRTGACACTKGGPPCTLCTAPTRCCERSADFVDVMS